MKLSDPRLGPLDFFFATACACLAVFTVGMGIGKEDVAWFLAVSALGASILGFLLSNRLNETKLHRWDGVLYTAACIAALIEVRALNGLLPSDGFDVPLLYAGGFSWMLVFGSALAWRDGTLLFQCVPGIALFGLVGAWDTYPAAVPLFFLFVLMACGLLARCHRRAMLAWAGRALQGREPTTSELEPLSRRLMAGAWRNAAGPGWSLAVVAGVVMLSLVLAPLARRSVRGVSGQVQAVLPAAPAPNPVAPTNYGAAQDVLRIGQGPRQVTGTPVLKVWIDRPRYLRGATYYRYSPNGWAKTPVEPVGFDGRLAGREPIGGLGTMHYPVDPKLLRYEILVLSGWHTALYVPGRPVELPRGENGVVLLHDDTLHRGRPFGSGERYRARVLVTDVRPTVAGTPPAATRREANAYRDATAATPRLRAFASNLVQGAATDYDRMMRLQRGLAAQVRYNLLAEQTPVDVEPVDHFVFESREGYCDLFASALTLLARSQGLPARFVTGFYPTEIVRDAEGALTVTSANYHAWCEVFFHGVGWVPFDATIGAHQVPGAGVGQVPTEHIPFFRTVAFQTSIKVMTLLCVLGLLAFGLMGLRREPRTVAQVHEETVARLYAAFERSLWKRLRAKRAPQTTIREFASTAARTAGPAADEIERIARAFDAALYGPTPPPLAIEELRQNVSALERTLREREPVG